MMDLGETSNKMLYEQWWASLLSDATLALYKLTAIIKTKLWLLLLLFPFSSVQWKHFQQF